MDEKAKLHNQVVSNLRACLVSAQGGIPIASIGNDYRQLLGESIPYKKLGHTTLEEFLSELPGIKLKKRGSDTFVEVESTPNSEHISKLVEKQKRSEKGKKRFGSSAPLQALRKPPSSLKASGKLIKPQQRSNGNATSYYNPPPSQPSNKSNRAQNAPKRKPQALMEMKLAPLDVGKNSGDWEPSSLSPMTPPTPTTVIPGGVARQRPPGSGRIIHGMQPQPQPLQPMPTSPPTYIQRLQPVSPPPPQADFPYKNPAQKRLLQVTSNRLSSDSGTSTPDFNFQPQATSPTHPQPQQKMSVHHQQHQHGRHAAKHSNHHTTENYGKLTVIQQGPEPYLPGSFVDRLVQVMNKHRCPPPTFVLLPRRPKGSDFSLYSCRVVISFPETPTSNAKEHDYSTFPDEFEDPNMAKEKVAETAYLELFVNQRPKNSMMPTTKDLKLILDRVDGIVAGRTQGVWTYHIEIDYETKFHEKLPNNWVNLVKNVPHLMAEKLTESSIIIRAVQSNSSLNGNTISHAINEYFTPPRPVVPPSSNHWDIYVTRSLNSATIWLRFVGEEYSEKFEYLATEMEVFYNRSWERECRPRLERERYYAMVGPDTCARVRLLDFSPGDDKARVSFVDHGDVDHVALSSLRPLDDQFAQLPTQAVECSLYGLEEYKDSSILNQLLVEHIEGKVLVGEVVSVLPIKLILHDTSGDIPVNLNNFLAELMEVVECKPTLMESKSVYEAFLTHVSNTGDVFLQFPSKAITYIEQFLFEITPEVYNRIWITDKSLIQPQRIYVTKSKSDGRYTRVRVIRKLQDQVEVEMIDYGREMTIPFNSLLDSDEIAGVLNVIPPQCVRARLKDIPMSAFRKRAFTSALEGLVSVNERVVVKVESARGSAASDSGSSSLSNPDDEVPIVELFKRMQPQNLLISVNTTLRVNHPDLFDEHEDLVKSLQLANLKQELKQAKTAKINEKYFDVYVVSAANPLNFIIQPLDYRSKFKQMLSDMGKFYSSNDPGRMFTDIKVGQYCVAYIERLNGWYRGYIDKTVSFQDVSFYACDIGELHVINAQSLRVLELEFMDVPALAFNAKLTGIVPLHGDWQVEDIRRFQELTENKKFCSIIESRTTASSSNKSGSSASPVAHRVTLGLKLIDTSTSADVDIAHTFVIESRAKYV